MRNFEDGMLTISSLAPPPPNFGHLISFPTALEYIMRRHFRIRHSALVKFRGFKPYFCIIIMSKNI
jgi:hypothetical protein